MLLESLNIPLIISFRQGVRPGKLALDFANVFKAFIGTNYLAAAFQFSQAGLVVSQQGNLKLAQLRNTAHTSTQLLDLSSSLVTDIRVRVFVWVRAVFCKTRECGLYSAIAPKCYLNHLRMKECININYICIVSFTDVFKFYFSGLVGRSWAMIFASAGYTVSLYDIEPKQVSMVSGQWARS